MKMTKTKLAKMIREELDEIIGEPRGFIKKTGPPDTIEVFNNIRHLWPTPESGETEQIGALEDIYRLLDKALVGTGKQTGLLRTVREGISSYKGRFDAGYKDPEEIVPSMGGFGGGEAERIQRLSGEEWHDHVRQNIKWYKNKEAALLTAVEEIKPKLEKFQKFVSKGAVGRSMAQQSDKLEKEHKKLQREIEWTGKRIKRLERELPRKKHIPSWKRYKKEY